MLERLKLHECTVKVVPATVFRLLIVKIEYKNGHFKALNVSVHPVDENKIM